MKDLTAPHTVGLRLIRREGTAPGELSVLEPLLSRGPSQALRGHRGDIAQAGIPGGWGCGFLASAGSADSLCWCS